MTIAIVGYGVEGKASYTYWNTPENTLTIVDERSEINDLPEGALTLLGPDVFDRLSEFDMIVRSPSIHPNRLPYGDAVWSATNEFFANCPAPIIGVTGTKGKGTTCSFIAGILRTAGKTVHLVGNIGVPALQVLPTIQSDDVVVYELSSFQLWDLRKSPHIAVVLMVEPDHLDVHTDMKEYVAAKSNIAIHQTPDDIIIYHPTNQFSGDIAQSSKGIQRRYSVANDGGVYVALNNFCVQNGPICSVNTLQVVGRHNQDNACAAITAIMAYNDSISSEVIAEGLRAFTGLPHRLKFIAEKQGVRYYDDSIATTPGSALAALASFTEPKIIILGGHNKGASYDEVIKQCRVTSASIIAIGETGAAIYERAKEQGVTAYRVEGGMSEVVASAAAIAQPGAVVILSPASASFDQYASYADRGEQFVAAVEALYIQ